MSLGWLRSRWVRLLLGIVVGAILGFAAYRGSRLTGRNLFVLCGSLAGAIIAIVLHAYSRSIRLSGITVSVPQFSKLHFAVTRDSRQVAWKLFVEVVTRISVQPLDARSGRLREALTSLYGLFATARELLKDSQPSPQTGKDPTVEHLAIAMLNNELRPFLSRWHPELLTWEKANPDRDENEWMYDAECRANLSDLAQRLLDYVLSFGKLAGVPNAQQIVSGTLGAQFGRKGSTVPQQFGQSLP